jgi:hypothetical protein
LWRSLGALDAYRRRFESAPDTLTNPILLGTLLGPLGVSLHPVRHDVSHEAPDGRRRPQGPRLGELPLARRDVERLRQILGLQRRLHDLGASPRAQRAITHRSIFRDALTWLEIHGHSPEIVEHWKGVLVGEGAADAAEMSAEAEGIPRRRRRRRRRRRFSPQPQ